MSFENLKKQNEEKDKECKINLELKQSFLKEVESFKNSGDTKADVQTIKGFINSKTFNLFFQLIQVDQAKLIN